MERREFLGWLSVGGVASCLPLAIAACTPQTPRSSQAAPSPTVSPTASPVVGGFQAVGSVAELDQKGVILNEKSAATPVAIIRDPADASKVVALNPTCPHQGCLVDWQADKKLFVCPCHDSEFSPNGKVVKDPAEQDLPLYQAKIEGDTVWVKV
jgi:cytochrome b6-f complex iron-sulfur subunit